MSQPVPPRTPELYREARAQLGAEAPSRATLILGTALGLTIVAVFAGAWWADSRMPVPASPRHSRYDGRMPLPG